MRNVFFLGKARVQPYSKHSNCLVLQGHLMVSNLHCGPQVLSVLAAPYEVDQLILVWREFRVISY
jgi:hypothetical protein